MAQVAMYPLVAGGKETLLTADVTAADTTFYLEDLTNIPSAPNLITIKTSSVLWERCRYTARVVTSGVAGYITVERSGAWHASSASGNAALAWGTGSKVLRAVSESDFTVIQGNITDHETRVLEAESDIDTNASAISNHAANVSNPHAVTSAQTKAASGTIADIDVYVYNDATGNGTGTSKANAFTTIQAAFNSLPAIINHKVRIILCDGAASYQESPVLQRVVAGGSIEIRGEYYWCNQAASNTVSNRLVMNAGDDFSNVEVGDIVFLTVYSGTYGSSTPSASYYGTISDVTNKSSGYVTISMNASVTPTTTCRYVIVKTTLDGGTSYKPLTIKYTNAVSVNGLYLLNGGDIQIESIASIVTISACVMRTANTYSQCVCNSGGSATVEDSFFESTGSSAVGASVSVLSSGTISRCVFKGLSSAGYRCMSAVECSRLFVYFCHCITGGYGVMSQYLSRSRVQNCLIASGVSTGLIATSTSMVANISNSNSATTTISPATNSTDASLIN